VRNALVKRDGAEIETRIDGPEQPHHLLRQLDPRREKPAPEAAGALLKAVAELAHFFGAA